MAESSIVRLPASIEEPFEVYLNGVRQRQGVDYELRGRVLRFPRRLARDRVSGWRWLVGAFGIAAYEIANHTVQITTSGDLSQLADPTGTVTWWGVIQNVFFPVIFASGLGSLVKQIISYRGSTGER